MTTTNRIIVTVFEPESWDTFWSAWVGIPASIQGHQTKGLLAALGTQFVLSDKNFSAPQKRFGGLRMIRISGKLGGKAEEVGVRAVARGLAYLPFEVQRG